MPIDPNIALGIKPVDVANPLLIAAQREDQQFQRQRQLQQDSRQRRLDSEDMADRRQARHLNDLQIQQFEQELEQMDPTRLRALQGIAIDGIAAQELFSSGHFDDGATLLEDVGVRLDSLGMERGQLDRFFQIYEKNPQGAAKFWEVAMNEFRPYVKPLFRVRRDANGNPISQENLSTGEQSALPASMLQNGMGAESQFGGQVQVKDEAGNLFFATTRRNPQSGQVETALAPIGQDQTLRPQGRLSLVNDMGQTPSERTEAAGLEAGTKAAAEAAIRASEAAFEQLNGIEQSIGTYDEAISLLDQEDVDTGPILSRLPSFRENAIKLDNLQNRMGLNVIQNTTFGSLSEDELKFALNTALPTGLKPPALREWMVKKRDAQQKLAQELEKAAIYLGKPGNTITGYLEAQRNASNVIGVDY